MNENQVYDVVVIGLGPSGMMAVWNMKNNGINVIGIDRGKAYDKRVQLNPLDVANGFGGAGLFSDGKLSFYPAATRVWKNMDPIILEKSYKMLETQFNKLNYSIPKWNNEWISKNYVVESNIKINTVQYFDRNICMTFVKNVYEDIRDHIILEKTVERIEYFDDGLFCIHYGQQNCIKTHNIVLATGKLGNVILSKIENVVIPTKFRVEGGIRVETDNENFIPYDLPQLDYKYIEKLENGTEFRTFCCCLDGKILESEYCPKKSYNGTITDSSTGRSNVGLIIRSEEKDSIIAKDLMRFFEQQPFLFQINEQKRTSGFGKDIDSIINEKVLCVIKEKSENYNTKICGPEIEYCGEYPIFDWKSLKVKDYPIWVIGDLSSQYRGLIVALLSGLYVSIVFSNKK